MRLILFSKKTTIAHILADGPLIIAINGDNEIAKSGTVACQIGNRHMLSIQISEAARIGDALTNIAKRFSAGRAKKKTA